MLTTACVPEYVSGGVMKRRHRSRVSACAFLATLTCMAVVSGACATTVVRSHPGGVTSRVSRRVPVPIRGEEVSRVEWSLAPAVEDRAGNDEFPASSLLVREVEGEKVMTELVAELNRRSEHPKGPDSGRRWVVSFRVTQDEAATYMIGWRKHAGVSTAELDDRETYAAFVMVAEARTPGTTGKGRIWGLLTLRLSRSRLRTVQSDPQDLMAIGPQEWAHASSAANYEIAAGSPGAGGFLWKPFMSSAIMEQALVNNELQNRQTREQAWILLVRTLGAELATPMD